MHIYLDHTYTLQGSISSIVSYGSKMRSHLVKVMSQQHKNAEQAYHQASA